MAVACQRQGYEPDTGIDPALIELEAALRRDSEQERGRRRDNRVPHRVAERITRQFVFLAKAFLSMKPRIDPDAMRHTTQRREAAGVQIRRVCTRKPTDRTRDLRQPPPDVLDAKQHIRNAKL